MTDDRGLPEDFSALAGEHALGLLEGAELERARALAAAAPAFAAEVHRWLGQLGPMLDEVASVTAPADAWARIQAATGEPGASGNVHLLRRKLVMWRGVAGLTTALAASLALFVMVRSPLPAPAPPAPAPPATIQSTPMVARISDQKQVALVASWDPQRGQLLLATAAGMPVEHARSHELWVIPAGGKPRSLGVMPAGEQMLMRLPASESGMMREGATLAVSVEPLGGSPTGAPTGPVVASGTLKAA